MVAWRTVKWAAWAWLGLAAAVQVASSILHIQMRDASWAPIYWSDLIARAILIGILTLPRSVRQATQVNPADRDAPDIILWIARTGALAVAVILIDLLITGFIADEIAELFPNSVLFTFPAIGSQVFRVFYLTIGLFVIALCEELQDRRTLIELLLKEGSSPWLAVLVSGLVFAAFHWSRGPAMVVATLPLGLVMATIYYQFRSLWMVVAIHYALDLFFVGYYYKL